MKKLFLFLLILSFIFSSVYSADQWDKGSPQGSDDAKDIDTLVQENNSSIDRVLANHRQGCQISYLSASTLSVSVGEVMLSNSGGSIRLMQQNTSATTVSWADIDTGAESNATYYLYAFQETATDSDFDVTISLSSTTPTGKTYFKRLGSFVNSGGDIQDDNTIVNDDQHITNTQKDFGAKVSKSDGVSYLASTDGFFIGLITKDTLTNSGTITGYTDSASPPTTIMGYASVSSADGEWGNTRRSSFCMPVKKGDYYKGLHEYRNQDSGSQTWSYYWIPNE